MTKTIEKNWTGTTIVKLRQGTLPRRSLPKSWTDAAGMLKGKLPTDPVQWQREIRAEWDERLARQLELARNRDRR